MRYHTLVLIKPSAVQRGLCGVIIHRYEQAGLELVGIKLDQFPSEVFADLYREHEGRDYYQHLVEQMSSGKICAIVLAGPKGTVEKVRALNGATNPVEAVPGSIRGDYAVSMRPDNIVHASDSEASALREIAIFFPELTIN
ncbi:MAG: nucleoside-diphosphate kinase [Firmicutes bacterium]|nr:nucleoside-diphosphate kinase [Bacillota bacterium]